MIVLDASVLIAHLDAGDVHHERADRLLVEADDDLGASTITLTEVLVAPTRDGRSDVVLAALGGLGVDELAVPAVAASRLAQLREETGLKLPTAACSWLQRTKRRLLRPSTSASLQPRGAAA